MSCKVRVRLFVDAYDDVEEFVNAIASAAYSRDNRHTQEISQLLDVKLVSVCRKLVIHVEGHHHSQVHVDELRGKVQVSLEIGRVDYIHDDIRHVLNETFAYVKLFRTVCGK